MKLFLSILKWFFLTLFVLITGLYISGNQHLIKGVWIVYMHGDNTATIDDARFFDTRLVENGEPKPWPISKNYNTQKLSQELIKNLEETESVAFLIAKKGEIVYEQYWDGYSDTSHSNAFSASKSITTMLVQCAIQDGFIKSWDQKVTDFFPDIKGKFAAELTLRHLSTMTAGLSYNEHYKNPFDITAKTYYGPNVWDLMKEKVAVIKKPGSYEYQSGATQWLGMVLIKATGQHLADYASEKLWKPLGATHSAKWHTDGFMGTELAFCCFNSNARDFARFGQMLLQKGNYNGTQILDSNFVKMATKPFAVPYYGHSFWIYNELGTHVFAQRGILGQYIIVIPEHDLVIVRLGHQRGRKIDVHTTEFLAIVAEVLKQDRNGEFN